MVRDGYILLVVTASIIHYCLAWC